MNENPETYGLQILLLLFSVYCNTLITVIQECYVDFSNIQSDRILSPQATSVTACSLFIAALCTKEWRSAARGCRQQIEGRESFLVTSEVHHWLPHPPLYASGMNNILKIRLGWTG